MRSTPSGGDSLQRAGLSARAGPLRLPFLVLTPCCVLLGVASARRAGFSIDAGVFAWILLGALAAHIAVNALNEWCDFRSGLDAHTQRTPFSGGSGTLPQHPELAAYALGVGLCALALSAVIGIGLLVLRGAALLPLGLAGLALVASYSPWLVRRPWLCLLAPGLGFGPLMVLGTHVALTGQYSWVALSASLVPFFLANDLLLLNQFPDVDADRAVGRRNLPILYGRAVAARVYALLLAAAYTALIVGVGSATMPAAATLGLITLPLAVVAAAKVLQAPDDIPRLLPAMTLNVLVNLATPLLLAVGLWIG